MLNETAELTTPFLKQSEHYLEEALNPRQMRKLERKTKKQNAGMAKKQHASELASSDSNVRYIKTPKPLLPMNQSQAELIYSIEQKVQTIVFGPAGTGKTFIPSAMAADAFAKRDISKIIITRPNVPTGKSLGFFPGSADEKMANWTAPITSVLKQRLGQAVYEIACKKGDIEAIPFEVIRGHTFDNAFVILDEAENCTPHEIKAFLTRIGKNTTVVVNGDIAQSDISCESGLSYMLSVMKNNKRLNEMVGVVEFDVNDIVRSELCAAWIRAFQ